MGQERQPHFLYKTFGKYMGLTLDLASPDATLRSELQQLAKDHGLRVNFIMSATAQNTVQFKKRLDITIDEKTNRIATIAVPTPTET